MVATQKGELLLQKRAATKYHSPGLWSNTCCSHPKPGEALLAAAHRRLMQEMGFDCPLTPGFSFVYRVKLPNGLTEYEFDHVLRGRYEGAPAPDPAEVAEWQWMDEATLRRETAEHPATFTPWFLLALPSLLARGRT